MVHPLLLLLIACGGDEQERFAEPPAASAHPVVVNRPARLNRIETGQRDPATGRALAVVCATCHSLPVQAERKHDASKLERFHVGLTVSHGDLSCNACHDAGRPDALHLASGEQLAMSDAIELCAQCHGPQHRDYRHGSHGGVNGYWDRSRGPQLKNHCVDCHDPHLPAIAPVQPVLPPMDRRPLQEEHP